jgi:hypothetical protein
MKSSNNVPGLILEQGNEAQVVVAYAFPHLKPINSVSPDMFKWTLSKIKSISKGRVCRNHIILSTVFCLLQCFEMKKNYMNVSL